jgi:SNARE associated Golgi protein
VWYAFGRRYGARVLGFLCRVSLEPDSCVRNTQDRFARHGGWLILFSKFLPGLSTLTPPLAGVVNVGVSRFLLLDTIGILAQAVLLLGLGWALRGPFEQLALWLANTGGTTVLLLVGVPLAYIGWKYVRRQVVLRELRTARVLPADLKAQLDAGEPVFIVDLRHLLDAPIEPPTLPGALRMQPHELEVRHAEIPRDRDIILFCT